MLSLRYHGNKMGSRAGVSSIDIKMNQLMTRHLGEALTKPRWLQSVLSSSLLRTKSRTETQTPPRPHWEHTVLPYKLCESKRTETWSISQLLREMWRVPLFFQILMNWWSVVLFEKKQITHDSPLHLPSFNVGLFDFIQSHTHLGGNFLF